MKTLVKTERPENDWKEEIGLEEPESELPNDFIWSLFEGMKEDNLDVRLLGNTSGF
jgi:hypothetical protein